MPLDIPHCAHHHTSPMHAIWAPSLSRPGIEAHTPSIPVGWVLAAQAQQSQIQMIILTKGLLAEILAAWDDTTPVPLMLCS